MGRLLFFSSFAPLLRHSARSKKKVAFMVSSTACFFVLLPPSI